MSRQSTIIIMRHGHRLDHAFGTQNWGPLVFGVDPENNATGNMPTRLPMRTNLYEYELDVPISRNGQRQAEHLAEICRQAGFLPDRVYASPSTRCVQTANSVLRGLGLEGKRNIRVDLALHEPMQRQIPIQTPAQLYSVGWSIDLNYKPVIDCRNTPSIVGETAEKFYGRLQTVLKRIIQPATQAPRTILVVTHLPCVVPLAAMLNIDKCSDKRQYLRNFFEKSRTDVRYLSHFVARFNPREAVWHFQPTDFDPKRKRKPRELTNGDLIG